MYSVELTKKAHKSLKKIDRSILKRIFKALQDLSINPFPTGFKKLKGQTEEKYRIRVGDYRIIYTIRNGELIILVLTIGHRKDIYKGL